MGGEVSSIYSIHVIHKFIEIFPTDLVFLPQDRDNEFAINLELRTKTIYTPTYGIHLYSLKSSAFSFLGFPHPIC